MKKTFVNENVRLSAKKNFGGKEKLVDYYIEQPGKPKIYAFSKVYTQNTYDLCKAGIRINELSIRKSRDRGIMRLVNYLNLVLPHLCEYYELSRCDG